MLNANATPDHHNGSKGKKISGQENCRISLPSNFLAPCGSLSSPFRAFRVFRGSDRRSVSLRFLRLFVAKSSPPQPEPPPKPLGFQVKEAAARYKIRPRRSPRI